MELKTEEIIFTILFFAVNIFKNKFKMFETARMMFADTLVKNSGV
jgi:hypothetical protein